MDDERKLFKKELRRHEYHYFDGKIMGPPEAHEWEFMSAGTQHAWKGWQAARSLDKTSLQEIEDLVVKEIRRVQNVYDKLLGALNP